MDKVLLTEKQAKAMEDIVNAIGGEDASLTFESKASVGAYKIQGGVFYGERSEANTISNENFLDALYCGWEIAPEPDAAIREIVDKHRKVVRTYDVGEPQTSLIDVAQESVSRGYILGAIETLNTLGITIEGVND